MKRARSRRNAIQIIAIAAGAVILDHLTKFLVERSFRLGESVTLVDGFLWLTYVRNPGVGFGLFGDLEWKWRAPFFILTALGAAWVLTRIYRDIGSRLPVRVAMGLIAGGAVGNMIDRIRYRMVVDFIDMGVGSLRWPTYNAADSCITVGTCILLYVMWREKKL